MAQEDENKDISGSPFDLGTVQNLKFEDGIPSVENPDVPTDSKPVEKEGEKAIETKEIPAAKEDVKVEDDNLSINEAGQLVNGKGEVVAEKEKFTVKKDAEGKDYVELVEPSDAEILYNTIKDEFGIELTDAQGKPMVYENTHKGIAAMIADAASQIAVQREDTTYQAYPQAKAFLEHLMAGKDAQSFLEVPTTYRQIEIPKETDDNKAQLGGLYKDLIVSEFRSRYNYNTLDKNQKAAVDKQANDWYNYKKSTGTERDGAIDAQKMLVATEVQMEQRRDMENRQIIEQRKAENIQYWEGVKRQVVTEGKIGNLQIPATQRQAFYDYISKPVDKYGNTQEVLDASMGTQEANELNLQLALMRFKKFDVSEIAKMVAAQDKVNQLRLRQTADKLKLGVTQVDKTQNNIKDFTVENMRKVKFLD